VIPCLYLDLIGCIVTVGNSSSVSYTQYLSASRGPAIIVLLIALDGVKRPPEPRSLAVARYVQHQTVLSGRLLRAYEMMNSLRTNRRMARAIV
jgi:hypothetical protein